MTAGEQETDETTALALSARDGDPLAQAAFVRATQAEVWRFTAALVDPGAADDLTQETYLRAFRALDTFQARSTVRTWLLGIARRACADHLRAVVRRRRLDVRLAAQAATEGPAPDPTHRLSSADLLSRLSDERRTAFVLTQVLGLSYAEAAEVESVPVGTIRSRVARARDARERPRAGLVHSGDHPGGASSKPLKVKPGVTTQLTRPQPEGASVDCQA